MNVWRGLPPLSAEENGGCTYSGGLDGGDMTQLSSIGIVSQADVASAFRPLT
jgi:hypothetical protein